jgi:hypothetical protein
MAAVKGNIKTVKAASHNSLVAPARRRTYLNAFEIGSAASIGSALVFMLGITLTHCGPSLIIAIALLPLYLIIICCCAAVLAWRHPSVRPAMWATLLTLALSLVVIGAPLSSALILVGTPFFAAFLSASFARRLRLRQIGKTHSRT